MAAPLSYGVVRPPAPQLLLRAPDDVTVFQWHPSDPAVVVAGLANGQLLLWDLTPHLEGLRDGGCTWDHRSEGWGRRILSKFDSCDIILILSKQFSVGPSGMLCCCASSPATGS